MIRVMTSYSPALNTLQQGHLGKGSYSDVFEVVCKKPLNALKESNARRTRRCSLSSSVTSAALKGTGIPPHCGMPGYKYALKCLRPQIRSNIEQFIIGAEDVRRYIL